MNLCAYRELCDRLAEANLQAPSGTYTVPPLHRSRPSEGLVDLFLFQGGDCLEGSPLDKVVGFAWCPWSRPQDGAGTTGMGSPTQVGRPERLSPSERLCEALTSQLSKQRSQSSELQQTAGRSLKVRSPSW